MNNDWTSASQNLGPTSERLELGTFGTFRTWVWVRVRLRVASLSLSLSSTFEHTNQRERDSKAASKQEAKMRATQRRRSHSELLLVVIIVRSLTWWPRIAFESRVRAEISFVARFGLGEISEPICSFRLARLALGSAFERALQPTRRAEQVRPWRCLRASGCGLRAASCERLRWPRWLEWGADGEFYSLLMSGICVRGPRAAERAASPTNKLAINCERLTCLRFVCSFGPLLVAANANYRPNPIMLATKAKQCAL